MKKTTKKVKNEKKVVRSALLSVSNKKGLDKFARGLKDLGFELVSSGGTAKHLRKAGIKVTEVSKLTKYPHMLDGRVKTLHPVIHGAILADQTNPQHLKELRKFGIDPFELVVCNLYPFEQTISKPKCTMADAIENIDIGGPCMVRAAAKNHKSIAVVVDPDDYGQILADLTANDKGLSVERKQQLALKAFKHTKYYDSVIVKYLVGQLEGVDDFPKETEILLEKVQDLRYGENPHQKAAFYRELGSGKRMMGSAVTAAKQLHGKELSFNNIVDMEAAWACANYFAECTVAIIKHTNPCGVCTAKDLVTAYTKALECDPVSAFGSIVAANRRIDEDTAKEIIKLFVEVIVAPGFTPNALSVLKEKKNLRIMDMGENSIGKPFAGMDYKRVSGGVLIQEPDLATLGINDIKVVTNKQPTLGEMEDLFFAWGVAKHVKSNTIVLAKNGQAMGIGAGQMSRIEAAGLAVQRSRKAIKGAVLASDAFFPFADVVKLAAEQGISAIIQPGGSKRDQESIDAANAAGMAMVFTGRRHFKH